MSISSTPLTGDWIVVRRSGILPPGFTKRIAGHVGSTSWQRLRFDGFDVLTYAADEFELRYRHWPLRDRIRVRDGRRLGEGRCLGVRFCTFELVAASD